MDQIDLTRIDLNLLVLFDVLMRERNVTRAAQVLNRTQSSVSHALARLRAQLSDPILVRVQGRMEPSPMAQAMAEDVRGLLRGIERVLSPRAPFDPATSNRALRVVLPDFMAGVFAQALAAAAPAAPGMTIEWCAPGEQALQWLRDAHLDLALLPGTLPRPEGIAAEGLGALVWGCAVRPGHPDIERWGLRTWKAGHHVVVRLGDRLHNPVADGLRALGIERHVAVVLPSFMAVPQTLRAANYIATLPRPALREISAMHDLVSLPVPVPLPAVPFALFRAERYRRDEAITWFGDLLRAAFLRSFREDLAASGSSG